MKTAIFSFDEYIQAVEAYINTLDVIDIVWSNNSLIIYYL